MFHDHGGISPDAVSGQAFALATADLLHGRVIRLLGGADDGGEVEIAFAAFVDGVIHDETGAHKADTWMDRVATQAGHPDFWSYEIMPPHSHEKLRGDVSDADMENARLLAALVLAGKPDGRASGRETGR